MRNHGKDKQPSVTIKDVAKRAGTSIATVSYVISNRERPLRPELRARVLQAAKELNYVKNAAASSLKGKRRGLLAVVVAQFGNSFLKISISKCAGIESSTHKIRVPMSMSYVLKLYANIQLIF